MILKGSTLLYLCRKFKYEIPGESTHIIAIRGSFPLPFPGTKPFETGVPAQVKKLTQRNVNYKKASCTIGIWNTGTGDIALFPGSTVPSLHYLEQHPGAEKHFNILCPGKYRFVKGIHPRNTSGFQRHDALIMPGQGVIMRPELIRKRNRCQFSFNKLEYRVDFPGDNLHASRSEPYLPADSSDTVPVMSSGYSSSGCLTILGQPRAYVKGSYPFFWNAWEQFIQLLNTTTREKSFDLLLFDFSDFDDDSGIIETNILRWGSQGTWVFELQLKLSEISGNGADKPYYCGKADGIMEGETFSAFLRFMEDYSPRNLSGEVQLDRFKDITGHFLFKHKHYGHVIN